MKAGIEFRHSLKTIHERMSGWGSDIYTVQSEVNRGVVYVEKDGDVAICEGNNTLKFRKEVWQELVQVLNERNATKYGIRP